MKKLILAEALCGQTRLAVLEDGLLAEIYSESAEGERCVGNIYAGRVENVLPGMQAAFVNIGLEKNAYLSVADIPRGQERFGDRRKGCAAQRLHQNAPKARPRDFGAGDQGTRRHKRRADFLPHYIARPLLRSHAYGGLRWRIAKNHASGRARAVARFGRRLAPAGAWELL